MALSSEDLTNILSAQRCFILAIAESLTGEETHNIEILNRLVDIWETTSLIAEPNNLKPKTFDELIALATEIRELNNLFKL